MIEMYSMGPPSIQKLPEALHMLDNLHNRLYCQYLRNYLAKLYNIGVFSGVGKHCESDIF